MQYLQISESLSWYDFGSIQFSGLWSIWDDIIWPFITITEEAATLVFSAFGHKKRHCETDSTHTQNNAQQQEHFTKVYNSAQY